MDNKKTILDYFFDFGVILKGIDGILEIVGGFILLFIKPQTINSIVMALTQRELAEDPKDLLSNLIFQTAHDLSLSAKLFGAIYLLSHGIVKVILVISLLRNKLWAYPATIIFLVIFIFYQIYRFSHTHSLWLALFTLFDMMVVWLVWKEYKKLLTFKQQFATLQK